MTHRGTGSCPAGKPIKAAGFRPWGPRREQTADQAENYVRYNDAVAQCRFKTADDLIKLRSFYLTPAILG